jgi:Domain of unknown function (DUF4258)
VDGNYPEWWDWELSFIAHFDDRAELRGITELDVRAMLERPKGLERSHVEGRFVVYVQHQRRPWVVVVEPNSSSKVLDVVTAYEIKR